MTSERGPRGPKRRSGADPLGGGSVHQPNHRIQGGGYAMGHPPLLEDVPVDGFERVTDDEAIATTRPLAAEEGILADFSSGAVVAVALRLLADRHAGGTVVVVLADSGIKYLSTDLWPGA